MAAIVTTTRSNTTPDRLGYAFADSPLGRLLVACSDEGITWVSFADSDSAALDELADRFPGTVIEPASEPQVRWIDDALATVTSPNREPRAPLDLRGTEFQQAVWESLRAIPAGETRSYADVARSIGRPTAVRAVARACGANPVAILVPCHRVIGSDGSLTGYASGLARKRALIEREG